MDYINLPNDIKLPLIGLGTFPLHGNVLRNSIEMASNIGYQLIDTAHLYKNEQEIGGILRNLKSHEFHISSKICATQYNGRRRYLYLDKKSVRKSYKNSCRKLGVNRLSIYLLHSCFPYYVKAYMEMVSLYKDGEVGAIGVCNADINNLINIKKECGVYPMINQIEIHPFCSRKEIRDFCNENGIIIMAHSPFAHGDAMKELLENSTLQKIAIKHNKSVAQIILRWITQHNMIVVPRSTNYNRLKDNYEIFDFSLSEEDIHLINSLNRDQSYGVRSANQKE